MNKPIPMIAIAIALLAFGSARTAPMRSADDSVERIQDVLRRNARTEHQHRRNIETALSMIGRFRLDYPDSSNEAAANFLLAQCRIGLGEYEPALRNADSALALPLDERYLPVARYLRGCVLVSLSRQIEAIAGLEAMIATYPDHELVPEARIAVAQALGDAGEPHRAIAHLDTITRAGKPRWAVEAAQAMLPDLRLIGKPAPAFVVEAYDGGRLTLGDYRGKVVLLDFWATWCGPCRTTMPHVIALYDRYHDRGFDIIGISFDNSRNALVQYLERERIGWRQVYDGRGWNSAVGKLYEVRAIPRTFLLDREGRISGVDLLGERLDAAVARLLREE